MSTNIQRNKGRGSSYKFDRGGVPTEFGPYVGIVKNNVDSTRSGRLQVYIEQFGGNNPENKTLWRTVSYISPFYGSTPQNSATTTTGIGNFKGNAHSYGMWFTPPDLGVSVICFFVAGDPNQGYYLGCIPDPGSNHMLPAIGASKKFATQTDSQASLAQGANALQLPVVEINNENQSIHDNPRFWTETKPVHSYVFGVLSNQGLLGDYIRGAIGSNSQRESPSAAYGITTPGRPIYRGGSSETDIQDKLNSGALKLQDVNIEGRRGGHSLVMDDGDIQGKDNLVRLRSAKGHQITMSDEANCFYFIHGNGLTWLEFGEQGTVDIFSTNSVNLRTRGTINLHADKDININAGGTLNIRAKAMNIESQTSLNINSTDKLTLYSKSSIGVGSDGSISVNSSGGGWKTDGTLSLKASRIDLNSGSSPDKVSAPNKISEYKLDDTYFNGSSGWQVKQGALQTIVTRAPTHEPYPYHNKGVSVNVDLGGGSGLGDIGIENLGLADALGSVTDVSITDPIDYADVLSIGPADITVGSLNEAQVTGLVAQAKSSVGQAADVISVDKGIGQFGFKPEGLEAAGLLMPGASERLSKIVPGVPTAVDIAQATKLGMSPVNVAKQRKINETLASPGLWTGNKGVTGLDSFLANPQLQNTTQQQLMTTALRGLQSAGVANGKESANILGPLIQSATLFGVAATTAWSKNTANTATKTAINQTVKNAQYSTNFIDTKASTLVGFGKSAESSSNTVNRQGVDSSVKSSIGDTKIPSPSYKTVVREDTPQSAAETERNKFYTATDNYKNWADSIKSQLDGIYGDLLALESSATVSLTQVTALDTRFQTIKQQYNGQKASYINIIESLRQSATPELKAEFNNETATVNAVARIILGISQAIQELIILLRNRAR